MPDVLPQLPVSSGSPLPLGATLDRAKNGENFSVFSQHGKPGPSGLPDIQWPGCVLRAPGWNDPNSRVLAFTLAGEEGYSDLHVMLDMETQALGFELPPLPKKSWYRAIDTALAAPEDISAFGSEQLISGSQYVVNVRSVCVLISKPNQ